ncbi:MAG: NifB/NifX family molybdenum-iron cluster-binding protein [Promethearchaeota archaeon]
MVIVAIPSMGNGGLNEEMSSGFGRCPSFTFVEIEDKKVKAVKTIVNHASNAMGGAGIQASQIVGDNKANVAIVGFLGLNTANALDSLNIKIMQAPNKDITIKKVVDLYINGMLQEIKSANVESNYWMGGGISRGV